MSTNVRNRRDNGQPKGVQVEERYPEGDETGHGWRPENHWRDEDDEEYETSFKWPSGGADAEDQNLRRPVTGDRRERRNRHGIR
jgi:hypothetical protein